MKHWEKVALGIWFGGVGFFMLFTWYLFSDLSLQDPNVTIWWPIPDWWTIPAITWILLIVPTFFVTLGIRIREKEARIPQ